MKQIQALLIKLAAYYREQLPDFTIELYARDLKDIPIQDLDRAMTEIRRDPKITRCPLPAVIRDRLIPAVTPEFMATEAVAKIVQAVSMIGPYQVEKARQFIGELGWSVVKSEGGWEQLVSTVDNDNLGVLRAQWRGLALSHLTMSRAGNQEALPNKPLKGLGLPQFLSEMPRGAENKVTAEVPGGPEAPVDPRDGL